MIDAGVDAVLHREVHQRCAGESNGAGVRGELVANLAIVGIENQQEDPFDGSKASVTCNIVDRS